MKHWPILIRRELWEHRALWIAPLAVSGVIVLASLFFGHTNVSYDNTAPSGDVFERLLIGLSVPLYVTAGILGVTYFLDCLYADRRDRSVLFWKSLPVSDTTTVLVKFTVGLVLLPLATYLLAAVTGLLVEVILQVRSTLSVTQAAPPPWVLLEWLRMQVVLLYALVAGLLWYAPYAAYLMLVSAWARRSVYAWAFIPPVLIALLEHLLLGTNFFGGVVTRGFGEIMRLAFNLGHEINISLGSVFSQGQHTGPGGPGAARAALDHPPDPSVLLHSVPLWLGLLGAALMLWVAIRLRRYRDES
jgi:ABC-2 type transport system permease protein